MKYGQIMYYICMSVFVVTNKPLTDKIKHKYMTSFFRDNTCNICIYIGLVDPEEKVVSLYPLHHHLFLMKISVSKNQTNIQYGMHITIILKLYQEIHTAACNVCSDQVMLLL